MIYIAYYDKDPAAVILADSRKDADIAFASMGFVGISVEEIDPNAKNIGTHGVCFLLTSISANSRDFSHRIGGVDFRIWTRGLYSS